MKRSFFSKSVLQIVPWVILLLVLLACGKNEPFVPVGYAPPPTTVPPQAPIPPGYPSGGSYYPPGGQYNPYYSPNQFVPNVPNGYSNQYYPYLPLDYFMRQDPNMRGYWSGFWRGWNSYCQSQRCNPYDFSTFWFDYCPRAWANSPMMDVYRYFDVNIYFWVQPGMSFVPVRDPNYFWQHYSGYGYDGLAGTSCQAGCYY